MDIFDQIVRLRVEDWQDPNILDPKKMQIRKSTAKFERHFKSNLSKLLMTEGKTNSKPQYTLCFKDLANFMRIEFPKLKDNNDISIDNQETSRIIDIKPEGQKSPVSVDFYKKEDPFQTTDFKKNLFKGEENVKITKQIKLPRPSTSHKLYGGNVKASSGSDIYSNLQTINCDPATSMYQVNLISKHQVQRYMKSTKNSLVKKSFKSKSKGVLS